MICYSYIVWKILIFPHFINISGLYNKKSEKFFKFFPIINWHFPSLHVYCIYADKGVAEFLLRHPFFLFSDNRSLSSSLLSRFPLFLLVPSHPEENLRIMKSKLYSSIHIFNHLHILLWEQAAASALDKKSAGLLGSALFFFLFLSLIINAYLGALR